MTETAGSEIVERGNMLFVLDPWQAHFTKPIRYRSAWPTGILSKTHPEWIGKTAIHQGDGICRLEETGERFMLSYGGETKPDPEYCEERPIPQTPGAHEYRNGRWAI